MRRDSNRALLLKRDHRAGGSWLAGAATGRNHRIACQVIGIAASFGECLQHGPHCDHRLFISMPQEPRGQRWPTGWSWLPSEVGNFGSTHRNHSPAFNQAGTRGRGLFDVMWHAGGHGHEWVLLG